MKHYGDITKLSGYDLPTVDVITGGSPCQDLSVAGKRKGLAGERSGLYMEQIRICKEMRESNEQRGRTGELIKPRYMVWENVPGALSSQKGEDFRAVLEEIAKVVEPDAVIPGPPHGKWRKSGCIMGNGWSVAWRILDAQFWGVPQGRRRIALIADFGGQSAPEILFVRKSVCGDITESCEPCEKTSRNAKAHAGMAAGFNANAGEKISIGYGVEISPTLKAEQDTHVVYDCRGDGKTSPTLTGDHQNRVTDYTAICIQGNLERGANCNGTGVKKEQAYTLNTVDRHLVMAMSTGQTNAEIMQEMYIARRLTPLECERLQGHPDGWTDIPYYEKQRLVKRGENAGQYKTVRIKTSDSARYKALGNSIALPQWQWLSKRISACYEYTPTLGSLFDGIGGFPLVWERINGVGTALWASEIEPFPIAVTKYHFEDS